MKQGIWVWDANSGLLRQKLCYLCVKACYPPDGEQPQCEDETLPFPEQTDMLV